MAHTSMSVANNASFGNTCLSPYPSRTDLTDNERMILIVCFTLLTPMTLVLNGFLIVGLYKTKQYRNVSSRFILVLSMSDFCIGLIVQPAVIYLFMPSEESLNNCTASWYLTIMAYVLLNFSGLVIFMVSIDRFFRLRKSQKYVRSVTIRKVNLAISGALLFSVITACGAYISAMNDLFCYFNMVVITLNSLAAGGILMFYLMAWRNVRKRISTLQYFTRSKTSSTVNLQIKDNEAKASTVFNLRWSVLNRSKISLGVKKTRPHYDASMTRTVAAILFSCCITYPPYFAVSFYRSLTFTLEGHCNRQSHETNLWFFWTFFLMFVNSTVNAILYSCHNRQLKGLLKSIRKCGKDNFKGSVLDMSRVSTGTIVQVKSRTENVIL